MLWVLALALSLLAGWLLARALTANVWSGPRWTGMAGRAAMGVLFGPGLASVLFFALTALGAGTRFWAWAMLLGLAAASAAGLVRRRHPTAVSRVGWQWFLWIALAAGCVAFALDFEAAARANPQGEWDASAIWNLRARFLAGGGDTWRRAISADLGGGMAGAAHPGYPLFLSSFLALQWVVDGSYTAAAPITASLLIAMAVLALLVASLARRSPALGLLAGLALLSTELFASQAASQYSDLLQGLAFLAALVLLEAVDADGSQARLMAAGLAIGLAPWIKNEGQPFAVAAMAVATWRFRGRVVWLLAGAAPGLLATVALKTLAEGREAVIPATFGEALGKLAEASRWWQSLAGLGKGVLDAGPWWAHPVALVAALALALRLVPAAERRARAWLAIPIGATLAAAYGLYVVTTADLAWHLASSVERLLAQVWPSLLWLVFSMFRAPEEQLPDPGELVGVRMRRPSPAPRKRQRARGA
jgi:hypothetical protein